VRDAIADPAADSAAPPSALVLFATIGTSPPHKEFSVTGHEIRQRFLDFFAERGHRIVRSSSLVPANDPTLLFTNAGMNQFKEVFTGIEKRDYTRATSSQKCVRAGGKHNDLENVGYTRRHHTFFEMLGNFSFGDYFKAEAIEFAWDLITKVYGLPKDKLYVTVFREDDEAEALWQKVAGVPKSRIFRLDEKDNFWQMGETGPCGPCSEIHYDLGAEASDPGHEHEAFPSDAGGRFVEIWNLVFMQFDRDASGVLTPLPRPSIDTGAGLERLAAVLQHKLSNYDTDLIAPIIEHAAGLFGVTPGADARVDTALRIAADHARAAAFLIHDGVLPSNEGRGYVLRKIMRRAMRKVQALGVEDPFLFKLTGFVAELMKPAYPELMESVQRVARVVKDEEHRYATTFLQAEMQFERALKAVAGDTVPGDVSFKLYDTYGLGLEEQEDILRDRATPPFAIDREAFDREMEQQRERARASWKGAEKGAVVPAYQKLLEQGRTRFLGYDRLEATGKVAGLIVDRELVEQVPAGSKAELVLDQTPFYAESGGQVGDRGALFAENGEKVADVEAVFPGVRGLSVHRIATLAPIRIGDTLRAEVAEPLRDSTRRNHTATHLLQAALRQVLGTHVKQAGSVVEPDRLRFDFTHYAAMDRAELEEVERLMNREVLRNAPVETKVMPLDQAISTGAMALFGEKYGDEVRVVTVPGFSRELCGGTHVGRTGDIGVCKIVYEGSISAGVRRIEAITGEGALRQYQESSGVLKRVADMVRASEPELVEHVEKLLANERSLERQVEQLKEKLARAASGSLESQARAVNGSSILAARVDGMDRQQMRSLADSLRNKWKSAVVVLASGEDGNVSIVSAVTKDLTAKVHAGKLAGALAQAVGGKGGGRPDMAEGGGKDAAALDAGLETVLQTVTQALQ
jgi:alanyl-tRNA synthetase